jgi:hypothetical protein
MADKKISALTSASLPLAGTEVLPIVQSGATVKVAVDDLTAKNVRSNATTGILQIAGPVAASTRVMTVPNANFTAARTDAAQTFTGTQTFTTVTTQTLNLNDAFGTTLGVMAGSGSSLSSKLTMQLSNSNSNNSFVINDAFGTVAIYTFRGNQSFGFGVNAADCFLGLQKDGNTNRSINAAGTINASGADYAEYMEKSGDFVLQKGDIVGINAEGKLTNVFAEAVTFAVKSTNPSYVGGDTWGSEVALGKRPEPTAQAENETKEQYEARCTDFEQNDVDLKVWKDKLEAERQKVDRIAFAGQVPVNVLNAVSGQLIIPINDNGAIKGVAVNESDMTLPMYIKAVGRVIAVEGDGRARIIVKVA